MSRPTDAGDRLAVAAPLSRRAFLPAALLPAALAAAGAGRASAQAGPGRAHPLKKALAYARAGLAAAEALPAYTATLTRRELVDGEPTGGVIALKFRAEPFSVYMRFVDPEAAGRQVLFVEGAHGGKLLAKEATGMKSMMGTVELAPDSSLVKSQSRYPITSAGVANLARGVIAQWEKESKFGECEVRYFSDISLGGKDVVMIQSSHPVPRRDFPFAQTQLWMEKATKLPVRKMQWEFRRGGGKPVLAEDYAYTEITPERLTAADFDRREYKL